MIQLVLKCSHKFILIFVKVLELSKYCRGDPHMTGNMNVGSLRSLGIIVDMINDTVDGAA